MSSPCLWPGHSLAPGNAAARRNPPRASAAKTWRARVSALHLEFRARRTVWERFTRLAMAEPGRAPTEADFETIIGNTATAARASAGEVLLVGLAPAIPNFSPCGPCGRCNRRMSFSSTISSRHRCWNWRGGKPTGFQWVSAGSSRPARRGHLRADDRFWRSMARPSCASRGVTPWSSPGQRGDRRSGCRGHRRVRHPRVTAASAAAASLNLSLTERTLAEGCSCDGPCARGILPDDLNCMRSLIRSQRPSSTWAFARCRNIARG